MSGENVELMRRLFEVVNTRDIEAIIAFCDPGVEFHFVNAAVDDAVYHGHDGMREWYQDLKEVWGDEIRIEPEAFFDLGERTLSFHGVRGRGQLSGAEVGARNAALARWRDDRLFYLKAYAQRRDAMSDLGLSEAEMEPIEP
jgi:ketosteroid isomerase-like protein